MADSDRPAGEALSAFMIFADRDWWWLVVPRVCLRGRERDVHHRRTFKEVVNLMDFYLGRSQAAAYWESDHERIEI